MTAHWIWPPAIAGTVAWCWFVSGIVGLSWDWWPL